MIKRQPGKTKKAAKNTAKFSTNWMKSATEFTMTVSMINRLSSRGGSATTYATWDNPSITDIKKAPRSDIGNAIIEQYLDELVQNDQRILKQIVD